MTSPLEQCRDALRRLTGAAFPVSTEIDSSGYAWSHAYLDSALPGARAALAAADAALAAQPEPMFYVRLMPNGIYEGPHHAKSYGGKMLRDENPGAWTPLYAAPVAAPVAQPLTDEHVDAVVRSVQPHLDVGCRAWKELADECRYWLEADLAAHGIAPKEPA